MKREDLTSLTAKSVWSCCDSRGCEAERCGGVVSCLWDTEDVRAGPNVWWELLVENREFSKEVCCVTFPGD